MNHKLQDTAMYQTKDYDSFKILNYNRPVDDLRVEGLMKSIKEHGFLLPILVSSDMQVADGQHRLAAAKRLGVDVSYIKYNIDGNKLPILISKLNSLSKNWKSVNYYEMWSELGISTYVWMGDMIEKHDVTFEELFKMCGNACSGFHQKFKDGDLTFTETQKARIENYAIMFNSVVHFSSVFSGDGFGNVFRIAVLSIIKHVDYNNERMLRKLNKDAGRLLACVNKTDFIIQLEHVYNHGERKQIDFIRSKTKKADTARIKSRQSRGDNDRQ